MSDLAEIIKGRRSIRKYVERDVPESIMSRIFEAIKWSPSWANTQCWEIIVVKEAALKESLQQILSPVNPAKKAMKEAPVVLGVCGKQNVAGFFKGEAATKFGDWLMFDLGIVTQNICLTAHAEGLATVITGSFDHDKAKEILGVPEGVELMVMIPLGYPAKDGSAPKRKEADAFVHQNKF